MYLSVVFCLVKTGLFVADIFKQRKCQLLLNDPALSDEMQSCREYILVCNLMINYENFRFDLISYVLQLQTILIVILTALLIYINSSKFKSWILSVVSGSRDMRLVWEHCFRFALFCERRVGCLPFQYCFPFFRNVGNHVIVWSMGNVWSTPSDSCRLASRKLWLSFGLISSFNLISGCDVRLSLLLKQGWHFLAKSCSSWTFSTHWV